MQAATRAWPGVLVAILLTGSVSPAAAQSRQDGAVPTRTLDTVRVPAPEGVGPRRPTVLLPTEPVLPAPYRWTEQTANRMDNLTVSLSGTAVVILLIVLLILVID